MLKRPLEGLRCMGDPMNVCNPMKLYETTKTPKRLEMWIFESNFQGKTNLKCFKKYVKARAQNILKKTGILKNIF